MAHDHTHKLDVACMTCVVQRVRERDKLLAFVRKLITNDHGMDYWEIADKAANLLKELGFKNES